MAKAIVWIAKNVANCQNCKKDVKIVKRCENGQKFKKTKISEKVEQKLRTSWKKVEKSWRKKVEKS